MASATTLKLESLVLSAAELKHKTGWDDTIIREWLNFIRNLVLLAELLDIEINQKIEEVPTDFIDGSIPFAEGGFLVENNASLFWDNGSDTLDIDGDIDVTDDLLVGLDATIGFDLSVGGSAEIDIDLLVSGNATVLGDIKGLNRAKQYFFAGF